MKKNETTKKKSVIISFYQFFVVILHSISQRFGFLRLHNTPKAAEGTIVR